MSFRLLLAFLFILGLGIFAACILEIIQYCWMTYGAALPPTFDLGYGSLPMQTVFSYVSDILIALEALIFLVLYIFIDRLFVYPVRMISKALNTFAQTGNQVPLPRFKTEGTEIRSLNHGFEQFIEGVDEVHKRDVEVSRVKSDFISTAAHQIRTPLTGIRWALEALEKEPLTELQQSLVKNAVDKSRDLVAIVGTLLDISSIESGKYKYAFEITEAFPLLEQVTNDFQVLAQKNTVSLSCEKPKEQIPPVRIDQNRIKWVLNNLVENAIRYTPVGGSVRVSLSSNAERVLIQVSDTGIGIPSQDRANIFERFYRAGNAITKENQGNGLGLYIARTIATDHGGDLGFEPNEEGPGTTFTLSLPLASTVAPPVG